MEVEQILLTVAVINFNLSSHQVVIKRIMKMIIVIIIKIMIKIISIKSI